MITVQLIIIFMIIAALIAVEAKDLISSVIAIGAVGLAQSLCFLLLQSPDLAIILLVVELLILTMLVRLIGPASGNARQRWGFAGRIAAIVMAALLVFICVLALVGIPALNRPKPGVASVYSGLSLAGSGTANAVAAVALHFRGLDTVAGIAVLLLVALGVSSIMGKKERTLR